MFLDLALTSSRNLKCRTQGVHNHGSSRIMAPGASPWQCS